MELVMGITTLQVVDVAFGSIANLGVRVKKPSAFVCLRQTPSPRGRNSLELVMGLEPMTFRLRIECTTGCATPANFDLLILSYPSKKYQAFDLNFFI